MLRLTSALTLAILSAAPNVADATELDAQRSRIIEEADISPDEVVLLDATLVIAMQLLESGDRATPFVSIRVRGQQRGVATPRSWESEVQANCREGLMRRIWGVTFDEARRQGQARRDDVPGAWERPQPGAAERVMRAVCDPAFTWPLRVQRDGPADRRAVSIPIPETDPPLQVVHGSRSVISPEQSARAAPGQISIQVGAAPSEEQALAWAQDALARLSGKSELAVRSQPVRHSGRTLHRALLTGFADEPTAQAACRDLRSGGTACLVRTSKPAAQSRAAADVAPAHQDRSRPRTHRP